MRRIALFILLAIALLALPQVIQAELSPICIPASDQDIKIHWADEVSVVYTTFPNSRHLTQPYLCKYEVGKGYQELVAAGYGLDVNDKGQLLYVKYDNGRKLLYLNDVHIPVDFTDISGADISESGQVVFSSYSASQKNDVVDIWDGSKVTQVTLGYHPIWSPDGTKIAFGSTEGWVCIYSLPEKRSSCIPFTKLDFYNGQNRDLFTWLPDNRSVLFTLHFYHMGLGEPEESEAMFKLNVDDMSVSRIADTLDIPGWYIVNVKDSEKYQLRVAHRNSFTLCLSNTEIVGINLVIQVNSQQCYE